MIKIATDAITMPPRLWDTRQDLNTDEVYVLTTNDGENLTWDLYVRADGSCRVVQWEDYVDEEGMVVETDESSIVVMNLQHFMNLLQDAAELAEGYFDNDAWAK